MATIVFLALIVFYLQWILHNLKHPKKAKKKNTRKEPLLQTLFGFPLYMGICVLLHKKPEELRVEVHKEEDPPEQVKTLSFVQGRSGLWIPAAR